MEKEPFERNAGGSARSGLLAKVTKEESKEGRLGTFALLLPSRRVLPLLEEEESS